MSETQDVQESLRTAVAAAAEKGALGPVALRVTEQFGLADVFLILTGAVERNVQAISDAIEESLNRSGVPTVRREGRESGRWVLLDFGDLIVHIFHQEERDFYQLEGLWSDCPAVDLSGMLDTSTDLRQ